MPNTKEYEHYVHHGYIVFVRKDLKGRHREFCMCYDCDKFYPEDRNKNCKVANLVFELCRANDLVLPVWECSRFVYRASRRRV